MNAHGKETGMTKTEDTVVRPVAYPTGTEGYNPCVPIAEKYLLTIREASAYFNLGVKHLRRLAEGNTDGFSICNGNRYMIIRPKFEKFLDESSSI